MQLTMTSEGEAATRTSPQLVVLEADPARCNEIAGLLQSQGYGVDCHVAPAEAVAAVRTRRPALLIMAAGHNAADAQGWLAELRAAARAQAIPTLDIVESGANSREIVDRHGEADGWVFRASLQLELLPRLELLLGRRRKCEGRDRDAASLPRDSRFFPLIVHDLRTPLNVIGLSLRMIDQALPRGNAELEEDFRFVEDNFKQIERMLSQLSDYCRLFEPELALSSCMFSPARMMEEVVEARGQKSVAKPSPVQIDVDPSCPEGVDLDPVRAKLAMQYALGNALSASNGVGVNVTLRGGPDRCILEFGVDLPPPPSVKATELRSHLFERLCGTAAERRGMDLAIAARVTEMFGGTARLEAVEMAGSQIILDWPVRIAGR